MQFSKLQMLPYEAKAISIWHDFDEAWLDVARGIRRLLRELPSEDSEHKVFRSKALNSRMKASFEILQSRFEDPGRLGGIAFGLQSLDELCDGVEPGDLTLIASRPDQGHVELILSLISNGASSEGSTSKRLLFSQRSSASQLTNRLLCGLGLVSRSRFARGSLDDDDWSRITSAIRLLKDIDLTVDDDRVLSAAELRTTLNSFRGQGIKLLVIDGIEYANGGGQEREIALHLADFAKHEGAAVVVTLTLSPELDSRTNRRPLISDLGSWHELGDLAGKVIFTYRAASADWASNEVGLEPYVEAALAKSPDGSQGQVKLNLHEESGSLYDPEAIPGRTETDSASS
jgi:replicative DNA helicase